MLGACGGTICGMKPETKILMSCGHYKSHDESYKGDVFSYIVCSHYYSEGEFFLIPQTMYHFFLFFFFLFKKGQIAS